MDSLLVNIFNYTETLAKRLSESFSTSLDSLASRVSTSWVNNISNLSTRLNDTWANKLDTNVTSLITSSDYNLSRASKLDSLDSTIDTIIDGSVYTSSKSDYLDKKISEVSGGIKRIQKGTIILYDGESYKGTVVVSVNMDKTELSIHGNTAGPTSVFAFGAEYVRVELVNSYTVTAQRSVTSGDCEVNWQLIEWY